MSLKTRVGTLALVYCKAGPWKAMASWERNTCECDGSPYERVLTELALFLLAEEDTRSQQPMAQKKLSASTYSFWRLFLGFQPPEG